ncbi:MAG: hypothetical protein ACE5HC_03305 [Candidatus Binatia bacterium]
MSLAILLCLLSTGVGLTMGSRDGLPSEHNRTAETGGWGFRRGETVALPLGRPPGLKHRGQYRLSSFSGVARPDYRIPSVEELFGVEESLLRLQDDQAGLNPADTFGSDPFRILYLPERKRFLVLLRNRSEILLTDASLNLLARTETPRSPAGWTLAGERFLFVGGELTSEVRLYEISSKSLRLRGRFFLHEATSVRDLVYVAPLHSLFLVDAFDRRLHQWVLAPNWSSQKRLDFRRKTFPLGAGPIQIRYRNHHLLVNLLLEHTLLILPLIQGVPDFSQSSRIIHDGPFWGFDAIARKDSLLIALGGVENRPLNRLGGEFGNIDSFLFIYSVPQDPVTGVYHWRSQDFRSTHLFHQENLSELNIVTPKALRFASESGDWVDLWVSAFGSPRLARFRIQEGKIRRTGNFQVPPGTTDFVMKGRPASTRKVRQGKSTLIITNSLFDRLFRLDVGVSGAHYREVKGLPSGPSRRSRESRIGETLFFTTLMTPHNRSVGELSRFTCETCHYEGDFDGRVHYTGRSHVFAATKSVRGLANNVPLFSRAGTQSLASMVLAEFHVANQGREDSFAIRLSEYPWLRELGDVPAVLSPTDLRRAFLAFFVDFEHRPNPLRAQGHKLSRIALKALGVFRDRCEYCHRALVSTRIAESLPYDAWKGLLETAGKDLVWGAPFYTKTGIRPYVYKAGARVPSLRRIYRKYPYFTNGSSHTLRDLLSRFRYRGTTAWHHYEAPPFQPQGAHVEADADRVKSLTSDEIDGLEKLMRFF